MKKSDLRTGMQVETREGKRYVVLLDTDAGDCLVTVGNDTWLDLNIFDDCLLCKGGDTRLDIMTAYRNSFCYQYTNHHMNDSHLCWEREEEVISEFLIDGVAYSESTLRSIIKKAHS